jgi:hypothetical protein
VFGPQAASFFLTQQTQLGFAHRKHQQQEQQEQQQQQQQDSPAVSAEVGNDSEKSGGSPRKAGPDLSERCCSEGYNSSDSAAGSYLELLSVWRALPRHVQNVLLQACSCQVLAAGQVLQDPTAAAAFGCYGLATGVLLEVEQKCGSGEAVAAVAAQSIVLLRASLTPRAAVAAAAAPGHDEHLGPAGSAMTPRTAAAAGWQAIREHVASGSGASGSAASSSAAEIEAQEKDVTEQLQQAKADGRTHSSQEGFASSSSSSSSSSAARSHKWDELSAAVLGPQVMKTAAFKALQREV